jgi:type IV pilus assembly protein PilV
MKAIKYNSQQGVFLLEALIGIIIFSIGVLTMVALQAKSIDIQSDAQFRIEAANLADKMLGDIALNINRTTPATVQAALPSFAHNTSGTNCSFSGGTIAGTSISNPIITAWVTEARRLPGTTTSMQQILVDTNTFNQVTITICWQSTADAVPRRHTVVSYIN